MSTFSDPDAAAAHDSGIYGFDVPVDQAAVVLLPVPFDATTTYGSGTCDGPRVMLSASRHLEFYDPDVGQAYEHGIVMLDEEATVREWSAEARSAVERARHTDGDARAAEVSRVDAACERLNDWLREQVSGLLDSDRIVGTVGGDHGSVFGAIAAHIERFEGLGVLHIDAHADLRPAYEGFRWSHASIMDNVLNQTTLSRLVQVGLRDVAPGEAERIRASESRIVAFWDHDLAGAMLEGTPFSSLVARIVGALPHEVYVSFDIDGLDPSLCPHTGTPVPGGLSFRQACTLLAGVVESGRRIVGFDLVEVAPGPDDEWDGNVGARILYKLSGHAIAGRG